MASRKNPQINWKDPIASALQALLRRAAASGSAKKATQVERVIQKSVAQAAAKGEDASVLRRALKGAVKEGTKTRANIREAERQIAKRANDAKLIKSHARTVNAGQLGEAISRKGTKIVGGKEMTLSKSKAEDAITMAKRATSQRAKGNATRKAQQDAIRAKFKAATTAAERYKYKNMLQKHVDKYGKY